MNRGPRIALTVRLPYDEYREVATRAKGRNWSLSDYVGWCVAKQVRPGTKDRATGSVSVNVPTRDWDDDG